MPKFSATLVISVWFILLSLNACKTKEVMIPAYIYLKPPVFTTKPDLSQGEPAAKITDYWVFEGEAVRGNFAPMLTIPIQKTGAATIRVSPGIRNTPSEIDPMFTTYSKVMNLTANRVDTIEPTFTYLDNVVFPLKEGFDGNGFAFEYNPQYKQIGDTILSDKGPDALIPGKFSGKVVMKTGPVLEIYSSVYQNWPRSAPFYLEFDYKNNVPFVFGLWVTPPAGSTRPIGPQRIFEFSPKDNWSKMYYDLTFEISKEDPGTQFRLYFQFFNTGTDPSVWLDNIKLVYLP